MAAITSYADLYEEKGSRNERKGKERSRSRDRGYDQHSDKYARDSRRHRSRSRSPDQYSGLRLSRDRSRDRNLHVPVGRYDRNSRYRGRDSRRDDSRERHRGRDDRDDDRYRRDGRDRRERTPEKGKRDGHGGNDMEPDEPELDLDIEIKIGGDDDEADKVLEESRKRRQAIIEKFKAQDPSTTTGKDQFSTSAAVASGRGDERFGLANGFVSKPFDSVVSTNGSNGNIPPSVGQPDSKKTRSTNEFSGDVKKQSGKASLPQSKDLTSPDLFADDMFGESPAAGRKLSKIDGVAKESGLNDNWDDAEGYYRKSQNFGLVVLDLLPACSFLPSLFSRQ